MSVPRWVRPVDRERFKKPWKVSPNRLRHRKFKKALWNHGLLSPHFTRAEAASKGGDSCGCPPEPVPASARGRAQKHAFKLERARHDLGDRSMSPLSWGRSDCHNRCVGGASLSQHKRWCATDWSEAQRLALGGSRFDDVMRKHFGRGGIGTSCGTSKIRHVDSRGWVARWCYPW